MTEQEQAALLGLSDERDAQLELRLAAWREGFAAAAAQFGDFYQQGVADGIAAMKREQHLLVKAVREHLTTWDGIREDFGSPRQGDYVAHFNA